MSNVVFTVGNALMGDDGAGPLLAELLEGAPAPGWIAIDGGAAPENVLHRVRAAEPERVLLVDAAELGLKPGAIRRIGPEQVARQFLLTTHALPLDILIASLGESVSEIVFIGIQPAEVAFFADMTVAVRAAVERVHSALFHGLPGDIPATAWAEAGEETDVVVVNQDGPGGTECAAWALTQEPNCG